MRAQVHDHRADELRQCPELVGQGDAQSTGVPC